MLVVLVPVLRETFDISLTLLSVMIGGGLLLSAIVTPLWGLLADKTGVETSLRLSASGALIGVCLFSAAIGLTVLEAAPLEAGLALLLIARALYSASAAPALPLAQARLAISNAPGTLLGAVGQLNAINNLGRLAGYALAAPLLLLGDAAPFAVLLPLYGLALAGLLMTPNPPVGKEAAISPVPTAPAGPVTAAAAGVFIAFIVQLTIGGAYVLLGPLALSRLAENASEASSLAGQVLSVALVCAFAAQLGLTRLFKTRLRPAFALGALCLAAGLWLLAISGTRGELMLAAGLVAIGGSLTLSANLAERLGPTTGACKARLSTKIASMQMLGLAAGTMVFGSLGDRDLASALSVCAAVSLGLLPGVFTFRQTPFLPARQTQRND
ncbi:MFS transporter [Breoghania sp.]|uniref:MFS transporter n=1 Tax=Breoghania sp. TaxID=2065378 RepID=UPI002AA88EB7|nr:MFS transporter [Breoghania sp.]